MAVRRRLDVEMVRRGVVDSRQEAKRLVQEKRVLINGAIADKAARMVAPAENIVLVGPKPKYVSRAGAKLEGALETFSIAVQGRLCLDAGSSTGGFTDCLLQMGAARVVAVDVGTHQLHEKLRGDSRVNLFEKTDIRNFSLDIVPSLPVGQACDLVVTDVSFISLTLVLEKLLSFVGTNGDLVVLIKPQFEAGRVEVSKGKGIITDPDIWKRVLLEVLSFACQLGVTIQGIARSSIKGTNGNVEFVAHLKKCVSAESTSVPEMEKLLIENDLFV